MKNRRGFGQSYGYYIDICGCFSETGGILFLYRRMPGQIVLFSHDIFSQINVVITTYNLTEIN